MTAIIEAELARGLRIKRAEGDELSYRTSTGGFDVGVVLLPNSGQTFKAKKNDQCVTRMIKTIQLRVTRDEGSEPPPTPTNKAGGRDVGARAQWFGQRTDAYAGAGLTVLNRLVRFFKFRMNSPYLHEFSGHEKCFNNVTWEDENGQKIHSGIVRVSLTIIGGMGRGLFGERDFTADYDSNLEECLNVVLEPEIFEEFLSDAQTSTLSKKLRRAVLEMAIACELAVKQLFFGEGLIASSVLEYLDERRRINVRVIELLDGVSKYTFGESFKEAKPSAFGDIDFLIRCRNKVAHRGELTYSDDSGKQHSVNLKTLERWWLSTDELMVWIKYRRSFLRRRKENPRSNNALQPTRTSRAAEL